jgi:diguanylate cyclase
LDDQTGSDRHSGNWRDLYEEIGAMLFENSLEPTPENFDICHRYLTANDTELNSRVDRALKDGGLTAVSVAAIIAQRSVALSADDLAQMASGAQQELNAILQIVSRSGFDVREYGEALADTSAKLTDPQMTSRTVSDLVTLTRAMIEKTRQVEEKLRQSADEITHLRDNLADARRRADSDPLTGLANRRALDRRIAAAIGNAAAKKAPLSIAICDIDRFKMINDKHGHLVGDEVIKFVASALTKDGDDRLFVARYGGEEFVMVYEGMDTAAAAAELNQVRERVAKLELKITATGTKLGRLTFSVGIAELSGRSSASELLRAADSALYRAKHDGRNRVYIADPSE